jgi:small nuclear ribonucleoprotein (snRNP)-like protein
VLAAEKNTEILMKDAIVTLVYGKGFFVQDKTGGHVLCYQNAAPSVKVGDKVDVSGKVSVYSNINQVASPVATVLSSDNAITWPTLAEPTAAEVDAFSNSAPGYLYAKITVTLDSGKNYEGKMAGGSTTVNITYDNAVTKPEKGATVTLKGYFYGHYNKAYFYACTAE